MLDNRILCKFDYEEIMQQQSGKSHYAGPVNGGSSVSGSGFNGGPAPAIMNGSARSTPTSVHLPPMTSMTGGEGGGTGGGGGGGGSGSSSGGGSGSPWCSNSLENLRRQTESLKKEIMNA